MDCGEQIALAFFCGVVALPLLLVASLEWMHRPWWLLRSREDRRRLRPSVAEARK
jgi:hypothetical protein